MANQILINNVPTFTEAPYPIDTEPSILSKKMSQSGTIRDVIRITIFATAAEAASTFINNVIWGIRAFDVDETGNVLETYNDYDNTEYCIAGDIIDHRNGTITVHMAKKTDEELKIEALEKQLEELQKSIK